MRHSCKLKLLVACLLMLIPTTAWGGKFMLGAKYWYAYWDSAVLDWFEKDVGVGFAANGLTLSSDIDTGTGFLAGPLLGYQSDDGIWSVSLAPMVFSDFSQDWSGKAGVMGVTTNIHTDRMDIDVAGTVALSNFADKSNIFKYLKIYAGYKYQDVNYDLSLTYDTPLMGAQKFDYDLEAKVHMPTVGVGLVYPVHDKVALGLQAGVGLALIDLELGNPDGSSFDISPSASITYNGEATASYLVTENLILQLGFRAQLWYLKARSPQRWEETESEDWTYGLTATVVYVF